MPVGLIIIAVVALVAVVVLGVAGVLEGAALAVLITGLAVGPMAAWAGQARANHKNGQNAGS